MITALCGGVGGSKLALGLYRMLPPDSLSVVVNTADDLHLWGLHVSPDLDTVTYTLAGIAGQAMGWGVEGDTRGALDMMGRYGAPTWFQIGDRDLATHVFRTEALQSGRRLTEVTAAVAASLGVRGAVLPMTDDPVATRLLVDGRWLHFQEYFVQRRHRDPVAAVRYEGIEEARPTGEVIEALRAAEAVIFVNSNPVLSIYPILSLPGVRDLLSGASAPCVAVSPIVGQDAVSGPAGRLMRLIGCPSSATGVARAYAGLIHGLVIDRQDAEQVPAVEALGLRTLVTETIMRTEDDRKRLAAETVSFARSLQ